MLTPDEQTKLVHVGPGTPMGAVMRRYWHPVALSDQVATDGAPLRAKLLGQHLVVFRDSNGEAGVLDEWCAHRGVSLALGRVEHCGIRCLYHGWKYGVDGTIHETPNDPDSRTRERVRQPSFPVREQSGLIWTYLGAPEAVPPFRRFAYDTVPDVQRTALRVNVRVNYLQLWEGGVDSSHVGLLHSNQVRPDWRVRQSALDAGLRRLIMVDQAPAIEAEDTAYGFHYAALRATNEDPSDPGRRFVRVVPVMMPGMRMIPQPTYTFTVFETPDDDGATSTYFVIHTTDGTPIDRQRHLTAMGLDDERFWNATECAFRADWSDRFGQDRAAMGDSWTGFRGQQVEDAVISLSCAPYSDRTREHLVAADAGITRLRRRLSDCIRLVESGAAPLGLEMADLTGITGCTIDIAAGTRWQDLVPQNVS
jgi:phthalate 4,5-dioxygenase oxygenase subunit